MDVHCVAATVKVIVVGNGQVGKTSMSTRYCKGKWTDTYKKTIGVDFMEKRIEVEDLGDTVCLMVWDTAGQEEFDSLTSRYYKGASSTQLVRTFARRACAHAAAARVHALRRWCGAAGVLYGGP